MFLFFPQRLKASEYLANAADTDPLYGKLLILHFFSASQLANFIGIAIIHSKIITTRYFELSAIYFLCSEVSFFL